MQKTGAATSIGFSAILSVLIPLKGYAAGLYVIHIYYLTLSGISSCSVIVFSIFWATDLLVRYFLDLFEVFDPIRKTGVIVGLSSSVLFSVFILAKPKRFSIADVFYILLAILACFLGSGLIFSVIDWIVKGFREK